MIREIVLDTETTGLDPLQDRIIEIGCVELINHVPTKKIYQQYINPQRDINPAAFEISGLSRDFLLSFPVFKDVVTEFLNFIGDTKLVVHNADFDRAFLNQELSVLGLPILPEERFVDTLKLARKKFPGSRASLDALCKRFDINLDQRVEKGHGALLDSELLAKVYLELLGGKQPDFLVKEKVMEEMIAVSLCERPRRTFIITEEDKKAHESLIDLLSDPLWKRGKKVEKIKQPL